MSITITKEAEDYISGILSQHVNNAFRIGIKFGGCQGFSYHFAIVPNVKKENDTVIHLSDTRSIVFVDSKSMELLEGSTIHYTSSLMWSGIVVTNPNEASRCSCGTSFTTKS